MMFPTALAVLLTIAQTPAESSRAQLIISPTWLAQHLHDPDLVLLHVGEKSEYDARHIPGAQYLDVHDIATSVPGGLTLELPDAGRLRETLAGFGISDTTHVVVYYGKDWISPSTRAVFTLDYAGIDRVSLLDGGMAAWIRNGHEVTAATPTPRRGTLSPLKTRPLVVDADFVKAHSATPQFAVVDARATEFYDGSKLGGPRDRPTAGHIAGARSVPYTSVVTDDLLWKSPDQLRALFTAAGIRPGDTVITYCHIGQQATATLFAARTLGHRVLLYDGSFEDWVRREYSVEK